MSSRIRSVAARVVTRLERERTEWQRNRVYASRAREQSGRAAELLAAHAPSLGPEEARVLADLRRGGWARTTFADLIGDAALFASLQDAGRAFAGSEAVAAGRAELARLQAAGADWRSKAHLIRLHPETPTLAPDDPWVTLALHPAVLGVVNTYLGVLARLHYLDLWYTLAVGAGERRKTSMNWHRDHEDRKLVKVWLYLCDVDETNGALEYVADSRRWTGPYRRVWSRRDQNYPPPGEFEALIPPEGRVLCDGPVGTLYFVDTTGWHRGGWATHRDRLFATWTLTTPAAEDECRVKIAPVPADWPLAARFAAGRTND